MSAPTVAIVSFRLGGTDGVAIEAAKWAWALETLGYRVVTVAGEGPVDHVVEGLAMGADEPPTVSAVAGILDQADLVVVENLCSLPLNPGAAAVVAEVLRGRPAVLHHHDLPWQRRRFAGSPPPPDDPHWVQVTVNELSRRQLAERGIAATVVRNTFDCDPPMGDRSGTREAMGIGDGHRLVLQPTRALDRKNIPGGLALAEKIGGVYWLLGDAEDGYGPELARLLAEARCPVIHGREANAGDGQDLNTTVRTIGVGDAYAACDVVVLPSTWEGFGNPAIESAVYRRPLAIGPYPVAAELAAFGFRWFAHDDAEGVARWLEEPDTALLDHNVATARRYFSLADLPARLAALRVVGTTDHPAQQVTPQRT